MSLQIQTRSDPTSPMLGGVRYSGLNPMSLMLDPASLDPTSLMSDPTITLKIRGADDPRDHPLDV